MDLKLNKKTALVTASTGGIGLAIARYLAQEEAYVIVNGRESKTVTRACEDIYSGCPTAKLLPLIADNGTAEGCKKTIKEHPKIDILVNNLGIYEAVSFFETTDERWQHLFEVNVMSGIRLSRHYLKEMLKQNSGRIVFISTESAVNPAPEMAHYSSTKLMQLGVSRSMAELTKGTNVTVNSVLPGATLTPGVEKFIREVFPGVDPVVAGKRFVSENRPNSLIQRLMLPEEVASFVAYLCSPLASAINGAALRVDGGLVRSAV